MSRLRVSECVTRLCINQLYEELEPERIGDPALITMNAHRTSELDYAKVNGQLRQQRTDMEERSFKVVRLQSLAEECCRVLWAAHCS